MAVTLETPNSETATFVLAADPVRLLDRLLSVSLPTAMRHRPGRGSIRRGATTLAVAAVGVFLATARAQDERAAEPDPTAPARAAFAAYRKATDACDAARQDAYRDGGASDAERAAMRPLDQAADAALKKFTAAFATTQITQWDLTADAEIASEGVYRNAVDAWAADDDERARQQFELLATRMPKSVYAKDVMAQRLPPLYASLGLMDEGIARMREFTPQLEGHQAAMTLIGTGDLLAAKGNFDEARQAWADAESARANGPPSPGAKVLGLDFAKLCLDLRKMVGEKAKLPAWVAWSGSKPSAFKGRVVLVYLLRAVAGTFHEARWLETVHRKFGSRGLVVIGVTSYERTVWPFTDADGADTTLPKDDSGIIPERVRVTPATLTKHVDAFRSRMKITFPIAIAAEPSLTPLATEVRDSSLFVIDPDQTFVFAGPGVERREAAGIAKFVWGRTLGAPKPPPSPPK